MANFKLDFNDTFEGGRKITDGEYEVFVNNVKEDATPGGTEYIEFDLIIRNDVTGNDFQNFHIFHKVWKTKATGKYNMKTFNTLGKNFQLQNGKQYNSFQALLDDFVGKMARVNVKNEEYNGYENLNCKYFNPTKFPQFAHLAKGKDQMTAQEMVDSGMEITDEDLPW